MREKPADILPRVEKPINWKECARCNPPGIGLDLYICQPIYLADTDISVSANGISVSAISVLASVSANLDISYIGIGKISVKIHGYRSKYRHISAKIPVIGQISVK